MPDGRMPSPEEFYSQCLGNVRSLDAAARRRAQQQDAVGAVACAWGADVYAVQSVLWERVLVAAPVPQRQYFRAADALFAALRGRGEAPGGGQSCADVLDRARGRMLAGFDAEAVTAITALWPDQSYLAALSAPTAEAWRTAAAERLGGLAPARFVEQRRSESAAAMARAQELRVRGETSPAIEAAYDSDLLALEGYLVESALAAGDELLLTVTVRWELVTTALGQVAALPQGFLAAVGVIRAAMAGAFPSADAQRLMAWFVPVQPRT